MWWNGRDDVDWRIPLALLTGGAAMLVAAVLSTRLPSSTRELSPLWTIATTFVVGSLSAACMALLKRVAGAQVSGTTSIAASLIASGVTSVAVLATAHRGGMFHLAFASGLCLLVTAAASWWAASSVGLATPVAVSSEISATAEETVRSETIPLSAAAANGELPAHVDQITSRYEADGRDHLEACVRVRFEAGQQSAVVHLPIQPAMQSAPEVECEPTGEDEVRITVDPVQPYGVRLVCRRPAGEAAAASEAIVSVLISADRLHRAAA